MTIARETSTSRDAGRLDAGRGGGEGSTSGDRGTSGPATASGAGVVGTGWSSAGVARWRGGGTTRLVRATLDCSMSIPVSVSTGILLFRSNAAELFCRRLEPYSWIQFQRDRGTAEP